ncbi:iron-sulfur cluster biosynthesis family protein [Metabacillus indicus]|uniref:iron-sulfur cluster biosynthesis family protein n=1 Tax=Metabacillus indicus TaxID=246786 RepID=UPI002A03A8BA|nr:iron-sulfur cluster biosynthesis family protein [Metabacillus indicus]MDX8290777.1 iron-sulfur cluster biosynthesis family protein [Metabacillus indicus]
MEIKWTDRAMKKIEGSVQAHSDKQVKLKYDTDGCGCVVSGVTALWLVDEKDGDDVLIETNAYPVLIEKSKMVFLDEKMTIDFNETANSYMLTCPSQILNPRMSLTVK